MPNVIEKVVNKVLDKGTTDNSADPIPTGAANLTLGTAFIVAVTLIVDNFTGWSSKLLGPDPSSGSQATLAIAIIGRPLRTPPQRPGARASPCRFPSSPPRTSSTGRSSRSTATGCSW